MNVTDETLLVITSCSNESLVGQGVEGIGYVPKPPLSMTMTLYAAQSLAPRERNKRG